VVLDGTLVRLRDIGDSVGAGQVNGGEGEGLAGGGDGGVYPVSTSGWSSEQQAVSTMHCTSAWSAMTTGGVLTYTTSCCSLPPACLSISPLCVKVELYEVPRIPRKEAKLILEQVDQASLSLSHSVLRGSE